MWKSRNDEKPTVSPTIPQPPAPVAPASTTYQPRTLETPKMESYRADVAHIGKSVIIKGELSGSEDLYLDGEVEGNIDLHDHNLVIGPNGKVRANVSAREVIVHGKVDGNIVGVDKVELKKSAVLSGDISTQRIVIVDGAFFMGGIDIRMAVVKTTPAAPPFSSSSSPTLLDEDN
jgi:cytoskeletal protein CcmA (bactofilin family)